VFSEANRFGADYELMLCSADGRDAASSTGVRVAVDPAVPSPAVMAGPCTT
jgi:hypothetical protein